MFHETHPQYFENQPDPVCIRDGTSREELWSEDPLHR